MNSFNINFHNKKLLNFGCGNRFHPAWTNANFTSSGEINQWMYDRYSLVLLLEQCRLENIVQRTVADSYIPDWAGFNLDTEIDGSVYKPDSLFMEAIKPSA